MKKLKRVEKYSENGKTSIAGFIAQEEQLDVLFNSLKGYCVYHFLLIHLQDHDEIIDRLDRAYARGAHIIESGVNEDGHNFCEEDEEIVYSFLDNNAYVAIRDDFEDGEDKYRSYYEEKYPTGIRCAACGDIIFERWYDDSLMVFLKDGTAENSTVYMDQNHKHWTNGPQGKVYVTLDNEDDSYVEVM